MWDDASHVTFSTFQPLRFTPCTALDFINITKYIVLYQVQNLITQQPLILLRGFKLYELLAMSPVYFLLAG
jgi:hypothetical protein